MRRLAAWDVDAYERILRWPLREALLAYEAAERADARDAYRDELLRHAVLAPWIKDADRQTPQPPAILGD